MASAGKTKRKAAQTLTVDGLPGDDPEALRAAAFTRPTVNGACTLQKVNEQAFGEIGLPQLVDELGKHAKAVQSGDLRRAEAMLMTQATTLDALFNTLTRRAILNMGDYMNAAETYLKLALKAQAQARATVEALAEMKNPRPVLIARQANVTTGPQQVNNGMPADGSRTKQSENRPTELLGASDGERLDRGTTGAAGGSDPALATVDAIHRAEDR